jgi:hypothetical protein
LQAHGKQLTSFLAMSTHIDEFDTNEGRVQILTTAKWCYVFPMPHTSVTPRRGADLKRLGTFIKWTTDDPALVLSLHASTIQLVQELGMSGLVETVNTAKTMQQVWKRSGGPGSGLQELVKLAAQDGVSFPIRENLLKYIKGFM